MGGVAGAILGLAALVGGMPGRPAVTAEQFQGWFEAAERGRLRVPEEAARRARGFRYVFVGGFAGELMPGYFDQNVRELVALGVPPGSVHAVFPSSHRATAANVGALRAEFRRLADLGPEPLVIVGHSRGASEALAAALADPAFVAARVAGLFLVQGAFGGTGLADSVLGLGEPIDRRMPAPARGIARVMGRFERSVLARGYHGGLPGLSRDAARDFWAEALRTHPGAAAVVGPKVFYVRSRVHPSRLKLRPFRKATGWYLETYYGPNDGVVAVEDQSLPGLGTCLGTFDLGHADLTNKFPAGRRSRKYRRALVGGVVMALASRADRPAAAAR